MSMYRDAYCCVANKRLNASKNLKLNLLTLTNFKIAYISKYVVAHTRLTKLMRDAT